MTSTLKNKSSDRKKGVVYVGHLPQKFEEHEIVNYFKQFGRVKRVKVSRSIKTGQPKGYGYVQFDDEEVARIAADTMNNYIMFKKSLKAQLLEPEKVHDDLFKGCSWMLEPNKNQQRAVAKLNNSSKKLKDVKKRVKRRKAALKKLQKIGYEFTMPAEEAPQKEDTPPSTESAKKSQNISDSKSKSLPSQSAVTTAEHTSSVKRKTKTPTTDSVVKKTKRVGKNVTVATATPTIIRDSATNQDSDDEIFFGTPVADSNTPSPSTQVNGKASSKRKSTGKKVFPKTPIPGNKSMAVSNKSMAVSSPPDVTAAPPSGLKKSASKSESVVTSDNSKVELSDASPALRARTVSKVNKTPAKTNQKSKPVVAKTPPRTSQKISPRVTRSVAKKRMANV